MTHTPKHHALLLFAILALLAGQCCGQGMFGELSSGDITEPGHHKAMSHDVDANGEHSGSHDLEQHTSSLEHACCKDSETSSSQQLHTQCQDCETEWITAPALAEKLNLFTVWFLAELETSVQHNELIVSFPETVSLFFLPDRNLLFCRFLI